MSGQDNQNDDDAGFLEKYPQDAYFAKRQKKAEQSFFGFAGTADPLHKGDDLTDDIDDEDLLETDNSSAKSNIKDNENSEFETRSNFGGIDIIWPTKGVLTSLFGPRTLRHVRRMHSGIDIGAPKGTMITSAANGQVLFAGRKRGYGLSVIIGHDNDHQTLYAHMSRILVRVGQFVPRNKKIGLVGRTGRVTGSNLHFETRVNGIAYNPLNYLPTAHDGRMKVGMRTPTLKEQLAFYQKNNHVAYETNE
jgi:murein DD-endopeptidase MepM/ murein hydrolase activator NlpD